MNRGTREPWECGRHLLWWHLANLLGVRPAGTGPGGDRDCRWPLTRCHHRFVDLDD